jgi:ketosteroid isomerase-like protein
MVRRGLAVLLAVLSLSTPTFASDVSEALTVFREYVARSDRFDPSVADLYADDAAIRTTRVLPDGTSQALALAGAQWKGLIRQVMPLAKARGDRNTFSKVSAKTVGKTVVITAERHSRLKGYTSPFSMVLARDPAGSWKITAESTETRP